MICFQSKKKLSAQLQEDHKIEIQCHTLSFTSHEEFIKWKQNEEVKSNSFCIHHSASRIYGQTKYQYLHCNRTGKVRLRGKGVRQIKMKGSCKTGVSSCVANMRVMADTNTHAVVVEYCSTHTGHEINICHLPIPSDVRLSIAVKLHVGVSVNKILDSIRDGAGNSKNRRRLLLLSRQDILNIQKKLNIKKHAHDRFSTFIWVEQLRSQPENPVLPYKAQGVPQSEGMDNLGNDDFYACTANTFSKRRSATVW